MSTGMESGAAANHGVKLRRRSSTARFKRGASKWAHSVGEKIHDKGANLQSKGKPAAARNPLRAHVWRDLVAQTAPGAARTGARERQEITRKRKQRASAGTLERGGRLACNAQQLEVRGVRARAPGRGGATAQAGLNELHRRAREGARAAVAARGACLKENTADMASRHICSEMSATRRAVPKTPWATRPRFLHDFTT